MVFNQVDLTRMSFLHFPLNMLFAWKSAHNNPLLG